MLFQLAPFIAVSFFCVPELDAHPADCALLLDCCDPESGARNTERFLQNAHFSFLNILQNVTIVVLSIVPVFVFKMGVFGAVIGFVVLTILVSALCQVLI